MRAGAAPWGCDGGAHRRVSSRQGRLPGKPAPSAGSAPGAPAPASGPPLMPVSPPQRAPRPGPTCAAASHEIRTSKRQPPIASSARHSSTAARRCPAAGRSGEGAAARRRASGGRRGRIRAVHTRPAVHTHQSEPPSASPGRPSRAARFRRHPPACRAALSLSASRSRPRCSSAASASHSPRRPAGRGGLETRVRQRGRRRAPLLLGHTCAGHAPVRRPFLDRAFHP
jgi:hypothetical protein